MNWIWLLFSFKGRINRAKYWLTYALYMAIGGAVGLLIYAIVRNEGISEMSLGRFGLVLALAGVTLILVSVSSVAVAVKRLHDRDKSGWWIALYYLVPLVVASIALAFDDERLDTVSAIVSSIANAWVIYDLGCMRGTSGANKYGPDPLAARDSHAPAQAS